MNLPETLYGVGDMEYMRINQVCWDDMYHILFIWTPDIYLYIYFSHPRLGNKWLGWKKVKNVCTIKNPKRMLGNHRKPPIRDFQRFMRMLTKNYPISTLIRTDPEAFRWLWNERYKTNRVG